VGAQQVFDACLRHGVARVLHGSTDEVYGSAGEQPCDERAPLRPSTPYAASKAAADLVAHGHAVSYGLDVRISRSTNNYGPRQFPEKLIARFVTNLLAGRPVPLYGTGEHRRDWLHVDDNCRALMSIAERGGHGEVYNVGGGTELSNLELTRLLVSELGGDESSVERVPDPRGPGHDLRYAVDTAKIASLGFVPAVDFRQGLTATINWYREHRDWWP
jgi:dTDP-glucose 4,6-dehydratase